MLKQEHPGPDQPNRRSIRTTDSHSRKSTKIQWPQQHRSDDEWRKEGTQRPAKFLAVYESKWNKEFSVMQTGANRYHVVAHGNAGIYIGPGML